MHYEHLQGLMEYVGFGPDCARALQRLHSLAAPSIPLIVDDFYAAIERHPEASAAITGGTPQVERLKQTLVAWLHSTLLGPHDASYLKARLRIGQVHVRIQLPQGFMFTAMNRIRRGLLEIVDAHTEGDERAQLEHAVNRILDLELAIMLDSYREDWMARVRANERLATIGQLAASIGHELRNPLGIVESSLFLLNTRLTKLELNDPTINKHLQRISGQVSACNGTISGLLEMARDSRPDRKTTAVLPIVRDAIESLSIPHGVELEAELDSDLTVYADAQHLKQVVANLIDNAVNALGGAGKIWIRGDADDKGTELLIQDDGPGVAPELGDRIFDVLVTTRAHGTGLGLALCRKMVERHQGVLELLRSERPGACFRVWFPRPSD